MRIGVCLAGIFATVSISLGASADVQHVIGKGHTLEAIAHRYHVSVQSIVDANHLKDPRHLKIGDVLTIPKADAHGADKKHDDKLGASTGHDRDGKKDGGKAKAGKDGKPESTTFAARPKTPGVLHIKRLATTEEQDLRVSDGGGHVAAATLRSFEKLLRSPSGASHPIEGRLVSLLGVVSNHFGSRKIEVISGFRPYTPTQYTQHSNHNHGKAVDFRVVGVPNEVVRDFCRTLKNVGCGYYPNSTFVHMDVREAPAFWIDYSRPGEPPRYNAANVEADEGTSDVQSEPHASANTPPPASNTTSAEPELVRPSSTDESDAVPAPKPAD